MSWDPFVLRKYNSTGHFRLLNQVRNELRGNPLLRPAEGESVAVANRSRSLSRALQVRPQGMAPARARRTAAAYPSVTVVSAAAVDGQEQAGSFRDRLNQIDMR
jgi:hypothetical protein